ncbi:MAG: HAD-IA family hydrolase [Burkholderiaceae bacterium]
MSSPPSPESARPAVLPADRTRRYDLLAFDWDGTLFDSTAIITRCIQLAVRDVGGTVPSDKAASHVIGLGLAQALALAAPDVPKERYAELGARYRHHFIGCQDDISLFDGVLPMLRGLKARQYWLAVATGKSRKGLDATLHAIELHGLFDASRTADETAGKPHPLMLQELMAEFGVAPERVLMIGDTTHDLLMARNAGCDSVAVGYGAHDAREFESQAPRYVAHSVAQLHAWLLGNG